MPFVRNINPIGDVEVPLLRRVVARRESVEVSDEQAERLLEQAENWAPADQAEAPAEPAPAEPAENEDEGIAP